MKKHVPHRNFKIERNRLYPESGFDTYRMRKKYPEPTICRHCGSLFIQGRWTWEDLPDHAHEADCPACQRMIDHFPAGLLTLNGTFLFTHKEELRNLIDNIAKKEVSAHPLERLMNIREENHKLLVTTTGMHLARRLGDALHRAYQGELNYSYDGEGLIRVLWYRDA